MKYQITSDNIEISESMKDLAQEKFSKVEKRLTKSENENALVRIVLNKSSADDEFEVKIELSFLGKVYFASEKDFQMETALIKAVEQVERMRKKDDVSSTENWEKKRALKRRNIDRYEKDNTEDIYTDDDYEDID